MSNDAGRARAGFASVYEGTQDDFDTIGEEFVRHASELPDRILAHLSLLADGMRGFPVDRLTHSLQAATLAHDDGRDEEYVVCALLHDVGDSLGAYNHPEIAAAILRPFVSDANHFMVAQHGLFQAAHMMRNRTDVDVRDQIRGHRHYRHAEQFASEYDFRAFDPKRPTRPLRFFESMVHRLFAAPRRSTPPRP